MTVNGSSIDNITWLKTCSASPNRYGRQSREQLMPERLLQAVFRSLLTSKTGRSAFAGSKGHCPVLQSGSDWGSWKVFELSGSRLSLKLPVGNWPLSCQAALRLAFTAFALETAHEEAGLRSAADPRNHTRPCDGVPEQTTCWASISRPAASAIFSHRSVQLADSRLLLIGVLR